MRNVIETIRQFTCGLRGHDEAFRFERGRLSLVCRSCGHQTPGWNLKREVAAHGNLAAPPPDWRTRAADWGRATWAALKAAAHVMATTIGDIRRHAASR